MEAGDDDIPFRPVELAGIEVVEENDFGGARSVRGRGTLSMRGRGRGNDEGG
jgi:hypothetical protein